MIELNGELCDYCKDCPHIELESFSFALGGKYFKCVNRELCAQLWKHLQRTATTTTDD